MRRLRLIALLLGAIVLSGCGFHVKDDALGKACDRVNNGLSSADINRETMAAFAASLVHWAKGGDQAVKTALAPLTASANAYATAPDAERAASGEQFWNAVGGLAHECSRNGTPMNP